MKAIKAYRVYTYDQARYQWVICSTHDNSDNTLNNYKAAIKAATTQLWAGKNVRVSPYNKPQLYIRPAYAGGSTEHRTQQAYQMSDKADANKRYKSPG